jgi:hypothetical protein
VADENPKSGKSSSAIRLTGSALSSKPKLLSPVIGLDITDYSVGGLLGRKKIRTVNGPRIGGTWLNFVQDKNSFDRDYHRVSSVTKKEICDKLALRDIGLGIDAIGIQDRIDGLGVHIIPVNMGNGDFSLIFINFAKNEISAKEQKKSFLASNFDINVTIETTVQDSSDEKTRRPEDDFQFPLEDDVFWISADLHSFFSELDAIRERIGGIEAFVEGAVKRIA